MAGGRPTKFNEEIQRQLLFCAKKGFTDAEMSELLGITEVTLNGWKKKHPKFFKALKENKDYADGPVVKSLYDQALDGNTTAIIFWLKNRQAKKWRDKTEFDVGETIESILKKISNG